MTIDLTRPEPGLDESAVSWFLLTTPELGVDIEHVPGLDGRPMLHDPTRGRYVALTPAADRLTLRFDGHSTGADIVRRAGWSQADPVIARVAVMASELRQLGFLTEPAHAEGLRIRASRFALKEHLVRFPLVTDVGRFLEPVVAPARRVPSTAIVTAWVTLSLLGLAVGAVALTHVRVDAMPPHAWLLLPLLVLQIVLHELSHALVCQFHRAPVRSAGVGLMLYVLPVGYVDRTDSHRVRGRPARVLISLAGPISDQIWFGVAGVVALTAGTGTSDMAVVMLVFQVLLTAMNLNPFTPSDGYHAVTAAYGVTNLRGKSLALVVHHVLGSPLPAHLLRVSDRERRVMVGYGLACLAFALVIALAVARSLVHLIGAL